MDASLKAPAKAADVARLIVEKHKPAPIEQMALQKLLYYCQALFLVWYGERLFPERIEAWANGPVVASFWRRHSYESYISNVPEGQPIDDKRVLAVVDQIEQSFGDMTGIQLSRQTHGEGPWLDARQGVEPGARSDAEILPEAIESFYRDHWAP